MPKTAEPQDAKPKPVSISFRIPPATAERFRNAVYWTAGETLVSVAMRALERELARMEKENGGPFEPRTKELARGQRPK